MNRKPRILVVGSFVMDHFALTRVFPKQGETVMGETMHKAPGGKGANQAVQAARLGAEVTMIGKLGRDANGVEMQAAIAESGVDTSHILFDDAAATACSFIILEPLKDGSIANRIIVIPGANMTIKAEEIAFLKTEIGLYDLVILQLEIPMEINRLVADYAAAAGVPVMLNPAPSDEIPQSLMDKLSFISPNEHEACSMTGVEIPNEDALSLEQAQAAARVLRDRGAKDVIITLGGSGAVDLNAQGFHYSPCVPNTCAVDPTAAGDSFVGAFCCATCIGMKAEDALCFANHTASLTVSRPGAMPSLPTLDEVEKHLAAKGKQLPYLERLR